MEFGRVKQVGEGALLLPPDDPMTDEVLAGLSDRRHDPLQLYVGCAQWRNKEWVGKVYPQTLKEKDFLGFYVKQFNCIELNALFYNLQPKPVIGKWASLADDGFRFCPKFSNTISHELQLRNAGQPTGLFTDHMQHFGGKLGYSFLQLSEQFAPYYTGMLQGYIRQLPRDFRTCMELRHEEWFAGQTPGRGGGGSAAIQDTWELMREMKVGTVITDTIGRRDVLHMRLTAPVAFIRFVGNSLHPTDYRRIDDWVDRIKSWVDNGLREVYFFLHNHEEWYTPDLCRYAIGQFNMKCGTSLKPPQLVAKPPENLSLF